MADVKKAMFDRLRKHLEAHDVRREQLIRLSRDVIKLSKQVIYAIHRQTVDEAVAWAKKMTQAMQKMDGLVDKQLYSQGAYRVAVQEYVEAMCYLTFVKDGKLLDQKTLKADPEGYLLGLCDLTGELIRYAVNAGSKGDFEEVVKTRDFVSDIYLNLLTFTFYGGELRKKFDGIKWDLKRLDEMVFELKVKDKLSKE